MKAGAVGILGVVSAPAASAVDRIEGDVSDDVKTLAAAGTVDVVEAARGAVPENVNTVAVSTPVFASATLTDTKGEGAVGVDNIGAPENVNAKPVGSLVSADTGVGVIGGASSAELEKASSAVRTLVLVGAVTGAVGTR
ncbi:hypothetical protein F4801DRAFT_543158 [Xylaria longipes]|nr:hypothetical protein F4801DRAFT_543158 [Xylaria longipes]